MNLYKLNDICINITDGTHSTVIDDENGSFYLLSCKNVKEGKITINKDDRHINENTLLQLRKRTKMEKDDVILTTVGTIGESSYIKNIDPNFEFQRSVAILKPNSTFILTKYLHYFLISNSGQSSISSRIKGAAQPCLFLSDLKNIEILLPNLVKQQHIVDTIGSVDDLIENYQKQIEKIIEIISINLSKYNDELCDFNIYNPNIIKSGILPFDKNKIYLDTSTVEGINNISSGDNISYNNRPSRANMQPSKDTIWFSKMKGSKKIIIITDEDRDLIDNTILSTGYMGLKASKKLPLSLLAGIIISNNFIKQRDLNSVGTTMAGINNDTFLKIKVPLLTDEDITEFNSFCYPFIEKMSSLRRKMNYLLKLKQILLAKYF